MKVAITGRPGSGKTTLCQRLIETLPQRAGGVLTRELRDERGERVGFEILDLLTGEAGTLAHIALEEGPRVGKYRVNVSDVERVGASAIERALQEAELIIIDEVAPMELHSPRFIEAVGRALESHLPLLITFQQRSRHPLVERVRKTCRVYQISAGNREEIFHKLLAEFSYGGRPGPSD